VDSLRATSWPISFDWSPDGDEIAFERPFPDGSTEIIRRSLKTGREQQLTNERCAIDDICWLSNGMLVFSSTKTGTPNIWCMPADGGPLQQLSRGSSEDINPRAPFDARRILYTQASATGEIRAFSLIDKSERVVSPVEGYVIAFSVSPDGKSISYGVLENGSSTMTKVYRSDIEGHSIQKIAETFGSVRSIVWSPRGGFASCESDLPDGSTVSRVLNTSSGAVRDTFINASVSWLSEDSLIVNADSGSFLFVQGQHTTVPLFRDSTRIWPIPGNPFFLYYDRRPSKGGALWLCEGSCLDPGSYGRAKPILQIDSRPTERTFLVRPSSAVVFLFETVGTGKVRVSRVSLPDRKVVRTLAVLSWDRRYYNTPDITPDGREAVYFVPKEHSKLNMITNPFK